MPNDDPQAADPRVRALIEAARVEARAEEEDRTAARGSESAGRPSALPHADSIPGYEIIREIHRGGQGVVYEAVQKATSRRVAVKILREGLFADERDLARFEREAQVLGQLQHPSIVTIHDSGCVGGLRYLVMDYVRGEPLDASMEGRERSVRETMDLFGKVCAAVNAAHLKGIIHRDLKPGNILVDESGNPRVLDFGLAKLAGWDVAPPGGGGPVMTITGQFVGSLPWASPEQVEGRPERIDLRTDVYSLGVILYQMLTGRFPYDVEGPMPEVMERIRASAPARPSTVRRRLDADAETIALKCLAKEPDRRYQSAGELSRDVERFLKGEAIEARPASMVYRTRKFVQRHQLMVATGVGVLLLYTVAFVLILGSLREAERQRAIAERERLVAVDARRATESQRLIAEERAMTIEQVARFQTSMLSWHDIEQAAADLMTAIRDEAQAAMMRRALPSAQITADLETMDRILTGASAIDIAFVVLDKNILAKGILGANELFADQPLVRASLLQHIAIAYREFWQCEAAMAPQQEALRLRRERLGDRHPDTLESIREMGDLLLECGEWERAEPYLREAVNVSRQILGDDALSTLRSIRSLALLLSQTLRPDEAEPLMTEALAGYCAAFGDEYPDTRFLVKQMGLVCFDLKRFDEAESFFLRALDTPRGAQGRWDPEMLDLMFRIGQLHEARGHFVKAAQCYREYVNGVRDICADNVFLLATALDSLANALERQGTLADAEPVRRESLASFARSTGFDSRYTREQCSDLAAILHAMGRLDEAAIYYRRALELTDDGGVLSEWQAECMTGLSRLLIETGESAHAEPLARWALIWLYRTPDSDPDYWMVGDARFALGSALSEMSRFAEAERELLESQKILATAQFVPPGRHRECIRMLVRMYDAWHAANPELGRATEAAAWHSKLNALPNERQVQDDQHADEARGVE